MKLRHAVIVSAIAYPICLAAIALALGLVGEGWWVTTLGLYLPQLGFALPLPLLALALAMYRMRGLLLAQLISLATLHYLVGFVLPFPTRATEGAPRLRVLSFNVDSGAAGYDDIVAKLKEYSPDVVALQESRYPPDGLSEMLRAHYPHVNHSTQFVLASRFPIVASTDPDSLPYFGRKRSPRFMRHLLATPLGEVAFYNVHPISPRGVLRVYRFRQVAHMLRSGELFSGDPESDVQGNAGLRTLQLEAVGSLASREKGPVVLAGDFNLPELSPTFRRNLSGYRDGFRVAAWGLGYTFPSKQPWLRLDRILANDSLRFTGFEVGCQGFSDHRCVVADLERR